jgi:hypothetical protein
MKSSNCTRNVDFKVASESKGKCCEVIELKLPQLMVSKILRTVAGLDSRAVDSHNECSAPQTEHAPHPAGTTT